MWTWERERRRAHREGQAQLGRMTLGGEQAAVNLGSERRWLTLCVPGGYCWRPGEEQQVLVLKAEGAGEVPCLLGTVGDSAGLEPGQVRISGGDCALFLGKELALTGPVTVNGEGLEELIRRIVSETAGG